MWDSNDFFSLPKTNKTFYITSYKGEISFVKPGKAFTLKNKSWIKMKKIEELHRKISQVKKSPSGSFSIHLPIIDPILLFHENRERGFVLSFPIPGVLPSESDKLPLVKGISPSGEEVLFSYPWEKLSSIPFFSKPKDPHTNFSLFVNSFGISDTGKIAAVVFEGNLWVWQQIPDQVKGMGFWTDLSAEPLFQIAKCQTDPHYSRQFNSLCCFDNPNEGAGICLLTASLPPCRPYDILDVFNSVCIFHATKPYFSNYSISIPILEGTEKPFFSWSPSGRLLVVCINNSIVLLSREMEIINILHYSDVFPISKAELWTSHQRDPFNKHFFVNDISWSCQEEFILITSTTGDISGISRTGESLRHTLCEELSPFMDGSYLPLYVTGDAEDPSKFLIYSKEKLRKLTVHIKEKLSLIEQYISLPFPLKNVAPLLDVTLSTLRASDLKNARNLMTILFSTEMFHLFENHSPLRYEISQLLIKYSRAVFKGGNDIFTYFIIRSIFWVTQIKVPIAEKVLTLLSNSNSPTNQLLKRILESELNKEDFLLFTKTHDLNRIKFYGNQEFISSAEKAKKMGNNDENSMSLNSQSKPPPARRNADVDLVIRYVNSLLYDPHFEFHYEEGVDLSILLDTMIQLERFDKAILIGLNSNYKAIEVFLKIIKNFPTNARLQYQGMEACINGSPAEEFDIRALCVQAIINILKQKIAESQIQSDQLSYISKLCLLEEEITVPIPQNDEEYDDFSGIVGIALAAADATPVFNYLNGRSILIHSELFKKIQDLFKLLWFLQWKRKSILEIRENNEPGNATLRLLPFSDFIETNLLLAQIQEMDPSQFDNELYEMYVNNPKEYEFDPEFLNFCRNESGDPRISRQTIARIQFKLSEDNLTKELEIPKSNLIISVIVSHLIPWLRTAIPRKMAHFSVKHTENHYNRSTSPDEWDNFPLCLIDFESYHFPKEKDSTKIESQTPLKIEPHFDESILKNNKKDDHENSLFEIEKPTRENPIETEVPHLEGSLIFKTRPKEEPEKKLPSPPPEVEPDEPSDGEEVDIYCKKRSNRKIEISDSDSDLSDTDFGIPKPQHQLINIQRRPYEQISYPHVVPIIPQQPQAPYPMINQDRNIPVKIGPNSYVMGGLAPGTLNIFEAQHAPQPGAAFGPIWDVNPLLYERPYPKEPPNIPMEKHVDPPVKISAGAQATPKQNVKPTVILAGPEKGGKGLPDVSSSSESFELNLEKCVNREPPMDPFPLDNGLHTRVEKLLNESESLDIYTVKLEKRPVFHHPDFI